MSTVGIAMIARNGAATMGRAIEPFIDHVDQIAIVLGGVSGDDTEQVAKSYTHLVAHYAGPVDVAGRLLDFAQARQQSFDLLDTDWALVVDTDDRWTDAGRVRETVEQAEKRGAVAVMFGYDVEGMFMYQLRLYRRDAGRWMAPIHEYYHLEGDDPLVIQTNLMGIHQPEAPPEYREERVNQNIEVGQRWLEENGPDRHTLSHLGKDLVSCTRYAEGVKVLSDYIDFYRQQNYNGKHEEELASVLYHKAGAEFLLCQYDQALMSLLALLATRDRAPGWALLAETFFTLGSHRTPALYELAVFCADRALAHGKTRGGYAADSTVSLRGAYQIKGQALMEMGRLEEARAAFDLGLMIDPGHKELDRLLNQVSDKLDELP